MSMTPIRLPVRAVSRRRWRPPWRLTARPQTWPKYELRSGNGGRTTGGAPPSDTAGHEDITAPRTVAASCASAAQGRRTTGGATAAASTGQGWANGGAGQDYARAADT